MIVLVNLEHDYGSIGRGPLYLSLFQRTIISEFISDLWIEARDEGDM